MDNIGAFRDRLTVLELAESDGVVTWEPRGKVWAKAERSAVPSIFSTHGISAEGWTFWVREFPVTLENALILDGRTHFLTAIEDLGSGFYKLSAARTPFLDCKATDATGETTAEFPAVLTEKYVKFSQENPMAQNTLLHVLITPKCINLREGDVVEVDGAIYCVQIGHRMDLAKNEFEVWRREDI